MNAIASGYTLILIFFPTKSSCGHFILILDLVNHLSVTCFLFFRLRNCDITYFCSSITCKQIVALLLDSSVSACIAIGQVGKKGNSHAGWLPICGQVPKFCDHVQGAMIAGFIAAIVYFLILIYSIHNVMNLFSLKTQTKKGLSFPVYGVRQPQLLRTIPSVFCCSFLDVVTLKGLEY